jgi:hypothetical protein
MNVEQDSSRGETYCINDGCEFTVTVGRRSLLVTNNEPRVSPSITRRAKLELCENNCLALRNWGPLPQINPRITLRLSVQLDPKPMHFPCEVKMYIKA